MNDHPPCNARVARDRAVALIASAAARAASHSRPSRSAWSSRFRPVAPSTSTRASCSSRCPKLLGQPVVIDNKAGASGMVGAELVAKSAPDGYTLLLGNIASLAINVGHLSEDALRPGEGFHADHPHRRRQLRAGRAIRALPVKTVAELIAYAKANPGKLAYGSAGSGSLPHLAVELFKAQTGTDIVHVPYKGGGPMVTDLLGGSVQLVIADQANLMPHVQTGKLRALAVATPQALAERARTLPTIAEIGTARLRRDGMAGTGRSRRHAARRRQASQRSVQQGDGDARRARETRRRRTRSGRRHARTNSAASSQRDRASGRRSRRTSAPRPNEPRRATRSAVRETLRHHH